MKAGRKVYIAVDMEGVSGVVSWKEVQRSGGTDFDAAARRMTAEVRAAVAGAYEGGATEVYLEEIHHPKRTVNIDEIDSRVVHVRGVAPGRLILPVLDSSFSAFALIGEHGIEDGEKNTLGHVFDGGNVAWLKIDGRSVGEVTVLTFLAAACGVPTVLVAGEAAAVEEARRADRNVTTVVTKTGLGPRSAVCYSTQRVCGEIQKRMADAVRKSSRRKPCVPPANMTVEVCLKSTVAAQAADLLPPGIVDRRKKVIRYKAKDCWELYRTFMVVLALADMGEYFGSC